MSTWTKDPSIAALIGAAGAYLLVFLTDLRRRYRKRTSIRNLMSDHLDTARFKTETVEDEIAKAAQSRVGGAPIMRFDTGTIRNLQSEVIDLLNANQNQAISAILYWMEAIDDELRLASQKATMVKALERREPDSQEKHHLFEEYKEILNESLRNLDTLKAMLNFYVDGQPENIVSIRHGGA